MSLIYYFLYYVKDLKLFLKNGKTITKAPIIER